MTSVTSEVTSVAGGPPRRVGILGGTFDPPHIGHLLAAVTVRHALGLDHVLLVPNGDPWQKRGRRDITPSAVRLEMVVAATAPRTGLDVSDIEVRRDGPSYTIDTIDELRRRDPSLAITLVLGQDAAGLLPTWHRHEDLLSQVRLAVVDRVRASDASPEEASPALASVGKRPSPTSAPPSVVVPMPRLEVSSSEIRARVGDGRPIDVLVPDGVLDIIARRGLYQLPGSA